MTQVAVIDLIADIAQIAREAPNPTIIRAYNRAAREFCRQSRWLRSSLPGETEAGTLLYSMGTDPDLEVIGLRAVSLARRTGNTRPRPLRVSTSTSWPSGERNAEPQRYAYVPEGQIALNPTPDAVYDLLMTLVIMPTLATNSVPAELLPRWDQTLQAGALAYLYEVPRGLDPRLGHDGGGLLSVHRVSVDAGAGAGDSGSARNPGAGHRPHFPGLDRTSARECRIDAFPTS